MIHPRIQKNSIVDHIYFFLILYYKSKKIIEYIQSELNFIFIINPKIVEFFSYKKTILNYQMIHYYHHMSVYLCLH